MATIATEYLADETTADVIIEIAKPKVRQKKLYLAAKRVFDIVFSALGLLILAMRQRSSTERERGQNLRG